MKIYISVLLFAIAVLGFTSCKKYNQVDNSSTVKTPYILFVGGLNGTLHKSNDALYFSTLFQTDGSAVRQILVADTMLLYIKDTFYYSKNEGKSFEMSNDHVAPFEDKFYKYYTPNKGLYDYIDSTVYLCTKSGIEKSDDNGETFAPHFSSVIPNSITMLENGNIFCIKDSFVYKSTHIFTPTFPWVSTSGFNLIPSLTPLPTDTAKWYITHKFNMLLAVDFTGKSGIYYSLDEGINWAQCTGLPTNRKILFGNQPLSTDNSYFAGLDSGGLWRLEGTNFVPSGQGIPWYAKVHFVKGKKVVYRTDVERFYHFCATNNGLFMSENDGKDWRLIKAGAYSTLQ